MPDNNDKLERLVREATAGLPARRAPRSLEQRVLMELERRAARPWWRKSFLHWPMPARVGFLVSSVVVAQMLFMLGMWGTAGFEMAHLRDVFMQQFGWMERGLTVFHAVRGFADILARNIPAAWFYGALAFFAMLYLTLFGLGAAAYKALHVQR